MNDDDTDLDAIARRLAALAELEAKVAAFAERTERATAAEEAKLAAEQQAQAEADAKARAEAEQQAALERQRRIFTDEIDEHVRETSFSEFFKKRG